MRLTKIHMKRFRGPVAAAVMFCGGIAAALTLQPDPQQLSNNLASSVSIPSQPADAEPVKVSAPEPEPVKTRPIFDRFTGWHIDGHIKLQDKIAYLLRSPEGRVLTVDNLRRQGVDVYPVSNCEVRLVSVTDLADNITLYAPVCSPEHLPDSQQAVAKAPPLRAPNNPLDAGLRVTGITNTKGAIQ